MRNGNPNLPANPFQTVGYANSRAAQGRNPLGVGVESLQGGVPQPPKINSIPGVGRNPLTPREGAGAREQYLNSQGVSYGGSQGVAQARPMFARGENPQALQGVGYTAFNDQYTLNGQPLTIDAYAELYRQVYGDAAYQELVRQGRLPGPAAADLLNY